MHIARKVKLYPTPDQITPLYKYAGACRFIWNHFLTYATNTYKITKKYPNYKDMSAYLTILKKQKDYSWLNNDAIATSLQKSLKSLSIAISQSIGKNKIKDRGFPVYKKKHRTIDSFYITNQQIKVNNCGKKGYISIPKIGYIKYKGKLLTDKIMSATISFDGIDWFCSITYEIPDTKKSDIHNIVGIDMGISTLITLNNGTKFNNQRILKKSEKKLKSLQRKYSRCKKGSNNQKKVLQSIRKKHRYIANKRKDYIHKITKHIITKYDMICIEDLNTKGMIKNHNLAKAIADCSFFEIKRQLRYKAERYGKHIIEIDRFYPSTKLCNCCMHKQKMKLSDRTFKCDNCSYVCDRDINAAMNICNEGVNIIRNKISNSAQAMRGVPLNTCSDICIVDISEKSLSGLMECV